MDDPSDTQGVLMLRNRVAELRKARGLTVDQLAVYSGVSRETIYKIERDEEYSPGGQLMAKLASYLDVELGDLFFAGGPADASAKEGAGARSD